MFDGIPAPTTATPLGRLISGSVRNIENFLPGVKEEDFHPLPPIVTPEASSPRSPKSKSREPTFGIKRIMTKYKNGNPHARITCNC